MQHLHRAIISPRQVDWPGVKMPYRNGEFLPVGSLSAFNRSSVRSIAVALKIFLDGSGQSEDASNQFLTLASIMASDDSWSTFEAAWSAALNRHGVPYSHMKELLAEKGRSTTGRIARR